jgi:isoleucyl-tRNA synthetase
LKFARNSGRILGPENEETVLKKWDAEHVFERSIQKRAGSTLFRFLEGPPTANGHPHPGHVRTRTIKDVVLRYKSMCGFYVPRDAGWDTHGLPVELEVQSELGLRSKADIESYGVEKFAEECRRNVFKYEQEWKEMTRRIGFWIDLDHPYITFENKYIESVWWSLKLLYDRGLLYKGFKVVPYCPRDGTPLSSHEVAQGYDETDDPSVYVKFELTTGPHRGEKLVAWTTTPWTLPSNIALAVKSDAEYVSFEYKGETLICASALLEKVFGNVRVIEKFLGRDLVGSSYIPPFDYTAGLPGKKHIVVAHDKVSLEEGTGVVHMAPAFGEEDYEVCKQNDLAFFQPVDSNGRFTQEVPDLNGIFVKEADSRIIQALKTKGLLVKSERYRHNYPFCWRCSSPLLYYAWPTWFIRTTIKKDLIIENNEKVKWYPQHIKDGRFGEFLEEMVDWALSRDRYWGTPLPVWVCSNCGAVEVVGSLEELRRKAIYAPENLELHKPFVDRILLRCPKCSGEMRREPVVIDVWYDSGAATFARYHYPFENQSTFDNNFPVDFITEGVDQTRGWFYSLHVLGSLLFESPAFQRCLVIGLVLNEKGEKMSKSKRNYVDPWELIRTHGSDPLRWHILGTTPTESVRFGERGVVEAKRRFFGILENVVSFFLTYAELDDFEWTGAVDTSILNTLDRWVLSKLQVLVRDVRSHLEDFEFNRAVEKMEKFLVDDVSQWFIRRSRRRFWKEDKDVDKWAAYQVLYYILLQFVKLIAPLAPFSAELVYQQLAPADGSVHLCDYPQFEQGFYFEQDMIDMERVLAVVEAVRNARGRANVRIRQPLLDVKVFCSNEVWASLQRNMETLLEEVNVKRVERLTQLPEGTVYALNAKPAEIGRRFKNKAAHVLRAVETNKNSIAKQLLETGSAGLDVDGQRESLSLNEFELNITTEPGYVHAQNGEVHVFLNTSIDEHLEREGIARDIVRHVQLMRKELNMNYDDRIILWIYSEDSSVQTAVAEFSDYIRSETLATQVITEKSELAQAVDLDDSTVWIHVKNPST